MSIDFYGVDMVAMEPGPRGPAVKSIWLEYTDPRNLNLSNENAVAVLKLLGMPVVDTRDLYGCIPLAEARRAVMQARARFARVAPGLVRAEVVEMGAFPVDGVVVELAPRYFAAGIDEGYLADRLERFARVVEALAEKGATHIAWA